MFGFLKKVGDYTRDAVGAANYLTQGLSVTFDHLRRRPITVQYPYEKLSPSERDRGRIHYEFDKCIACEVCVRVCPINLPVVDWVMNKATKKKELRNYSIDFGVCIFCGNCVEYCPTNCLSMTEEYELAAFDRHSLNYDNVALGRLPTSVTSDPAVLAPVVGQILFVVEADRTQRDEVEASLDLIQACPTITMVLNKQQISSRYTFGAYSSYYSS